VPSCYAPTAEIFAERTAHQDSPAQGPFVYVADGRCRKALAQKRHANALRELCGTEPAAYTRFRSLAMQRGRGRWDWTYVDYDQGEFEADASAAAGGEARDRERRQVDR
jgi:hypothetical protein